MTRLQFSIITIALLSFVLSGCVTKQKYTELEEKMSYYKGQAVASEELDAENEKMARENEHTKNDFTEMVREMEDLRAANINLNRSYKEVLNKLNSLKYENEEVLAASSYEHVGMQESLADMQARLDTKERELGILEYDLYQKESRLNQMQGTEYEMKGDIQAKNYRIEELEAAIAEKEARVKDLRQNIGNALSNISSEDLAVTERNGKLYLSLSQELLFTSGSDNINWDGKKALKKIAEVMSRNPDIDVMVEGHTDSDGIASRNWDLSVMRATAVVKVLTSSGVAPERVTAAGRGFYAPIASNRNALGKAKNRRTEIILSPKLDELYELMKE